MTITSKEQSSIIQSHKEKDTAHGSMTFVMEHLDTQHRGCMNSDRVGMHKKDFLDEASQSSQAIFTPHFLNTVVEVYSGMSGMPHV